ncbi:hypothetical protein HC823_00915 [Candidatus Gracilibacteria bacterium]|nr:hypothetical protein [Candidatus Gracilibacteria bacterium]
MDEETDDATEVDYELPDGFRTLLSGKVETTGDNAIKVEELPANLFSDDERSSFRPEIKNLFDLETFWTGDYKIGKKDFDLLSRWQPELEGSGFKAEKEDEFFTSADLDNPTKTENEQPVLWVDFEESFFGNVFSGRNRSFDSVGTFFNWLEHNQYKLDE